MSKILSYNNKTTGEGWISMNSQYSADEIEMISDPNGGLSESPRTAIPSPFAQMDLVKNAFQRLSTHNDLHGEKMDEKLVSDALDVAQLFFNYKELGNSFSIVVWDKATHIDILKSSAQHRLLGETLEIFLSQDANAFNFNDMDKLYFLVHDNQVIGSTSPVTLYMATPNATKDRFTVPVEQNMMLFGQWRPLHEREQHFIKYIYALFTAFPDLKKSCKEFNNYIIRNFDFLSQDLRNDIISGIGNPVAYDSMNTDKARTFLTSTYDTMEDGVQALGVPFFCARPQNRIADIAKSDFLLNPSRKVDERIPLVLQNHLNAATQDPFKYVVSNWDDTIIIKPEDYRMPPEKRILPATTHQYPWLTDDDFFQPSIIKLDYTSNHDCFFDGNIVTETTTADKYDFVLPIKPLFFKYFDVSDLWGTISGYPRFELRHSKVGQTESVKAILRIPIQKTGRFITLTRTYIESRNGNLCYDMKTDHGFFVTVSFAVSIFPFIKSESLRQYNVLLVDRALGVLENHDISLSFHKNGHMNAVPNENVLMRNRSRKAEKRVGSSYYRVSDNFDYIKVSLNGDNANNSAEGIICPKWTYHATGHEAYTFAVDFGTTNTHIECMRGNSMPEPLKIDSASHERFIATLYSGESILYDVIMRQEFLPKQINDTYGFPQRTVLSESEHLNAATADDIVALGDVNIPFIYEKESIGYGNRIVPNLKWSTDIANNKRVRSYLTELALLMRTKVLLENGDPCKTRLVWFYPLSMKIGKIRKMEDMWKEAFHNVFGVQAEGNVIQMPESVAPYYYYKCLGKFHGTTSSVASIDIGGGSTDVTVFEPNTRQPMTMTSFRFAANVLFGDGFSEIPRGDTNPMVMKYATYFHELFNSDDDKYGELNGILDDIMEKRKSEDINAFLFSIAQNRITKDNYVFSYNTRLSEDGVLKLVFIYFYVTIIYYVAKMMYHRGVTMPRNVMFSGTGSKVLDIVGSQDDLDILTQAVFEYIYNDRYDSDGFSVILERDEPKQITCRGALLQVRDGKGCDNVDELNHLMNDVKSPLKYNYSMLDKETLTYSDMDCDNVRLKIINAVREYNDFFVNLCDDIHVVDRFLVEYKAMQQFKSLINKDIEHHLANGWIFLNKNQEEKNSTEAIEDSVFFYPIIGIIRDNLIENLK